MSWLPSAVTELLDAALVADLTVVGRDGRPVTHPLIPFWDGTHILMTSSALFSRKVDHVRADGRVAVSIADHDGLTRPLPGRATIQGMARVVEDDPHVTWERVLPLWRAKEPVIDRFLKMRFALPLFFERAIIEVTPTRALLWPDGDAGTPPIETRAPATDEAAAPTSGVPVSTEAMP
jgi:general stress protein 26